MSGIERKRYVGKREKIEKNIYSLAKEKSDKLEKEEGKIKENIKLKNIGDRNTIFNEIKEKMDSIPKDKNIKLAQFSRFYKFVESYNFTMQSNQNIKEFIDKQIERKIAVGFYNYINKEIMSKKENIVENKTKLTIIEKYLKYEFGRERFEDKIKK